MQLLIQTPAPDYAAWKAGFDTESENIANAGLSVLQIWKAEDGAVLVLFSVASAARASEWLSNQAATGQSYHAQFLKTA